MAWYRIAYRPSVLVDLLAIEKGMAQRLFDKTKWLASNVENLRHDPLAPDLPGMAQYAVGNWRILYSIDHAEGSLLSNRIPEFQLFRLANHTPREHCPPGERSLHDEPCRPFSQGT